MSLTWQPCDWRETAAPVFHLAQPDAEQALCGLRVDWSEGARWRGGYLYQPTDSNTCSRCWVLADIAGEKVPPTFRERNAETTAQGELL